MNSDSTDAYYALGEALARSSRYEEAIEQYAKAIQLQPCLSLAYSQIAHCLAILGDHVGAAKYDKRALAITSTPPLNVHLTPDEITRDGSYPGWPKPVAINTKSAHLPIITFFRELHLNEAASRSLVYCLAQARRSNPQSDIILIGDAAHGYEFAHHDYILNYFTMAEEFAGIYKHVAKDARFDFILFCFQRWFVLLEFMSAFGLESCVHIDPDVMLYTDVTAWSLGHRYFDFRLSAHPNFGVSGHYNFIGSRLALEKYCDYVLETYSKPPRQKTAASRMRRAVWGKGAGYITDMDAFAEVRDAGICSFENLSMVANGSVWDANINSPDRFEFDRGMKSMYWIGEHAYCRAMNTEAPVRFHALHFNARAKKYMRNAFHKRRLWRRA